MPGDELFKRYLEIGATVLGMSRERAETIVRDLVASGEVAKGQATKAADWLVERSRSGSEEVAELVRREIRQQVTALGLASKDDLAGLQAQIDELRAAATPPAVAPEPAPTKAPARAPAKVGATRKRTAGAAMAAPAAESTPAAPFAGDAPAAPGTTTSAGISGSVSVRKRAGAPGPAKSGATPPAGGADRSKG